MARDLHSSFGPLGRRVVRRGALLAAALAGLALVAPAADAQALTGNNTKIKTAWSNFGVCPDQTVCAGWNRIGGSTTSATVTGTLAKPTDLGTTGAKNYVLAVLITAKYQTAQTTFAATVTYGGQTVSRWTSSDGSSQEKTWIGGLNDAGIGSATGAPPTLSVSVTPTASLNSVAVRAAYFIGVSQSTPVAASTSNQSDTASTSVPFGSSVSYVANGLVFYATNAEKNPTATPPTGYTGEVDETEFTGAQSQFQVSVASVERTAAGSSNDTVALSASSIYAISVISLQPATANIVHFPDARMCVTPCSTILWGGKEPHDFMADGGGPLQDFTSSTTVSGQVEISSGGTSATRTAANCNPGCPIPAGCTPGVNCLCTAGQGSCGPSTSAMYSYRYDSSKNMGYLFGRMRVAGNPTDGGANPPLLGTTFTSSHWNLLVSYDNDVFKEFWVDIDGGCNVGVTSSPADCVNIYYWNGNNGTLNSDTVEDELAFPTNQINNTCDVPGRVDSASSNCAENPAGFIRNKVNRFLGCTDDSQTNGPTGFDCASNSLSRAVYVKDTVAPADWYVDVQVPIAALTAYKGQNPALTGEQNLGYPGTTGQNTGARTPPFYTWDPNRSDVTGPRTDDAFDFYPLIQTVQPGMFISPPWGGSGPFAYQPSTTGTNSAVPQSIPTYLRLNYATCQSNTDPLQKDFLFPGNNPSDTTPVTLSRFKATPSATGYRIDWSTVNEVAHAGFDVLANGPFGWVTVNAQPITAQGSDPFAPQDYSIDVPFRAASEFKIVDIDVNGQRVEHGPFKAGEELGGRRPLQAVDWQRISAESGAKAAARHAAARGKASEKSRAVGAAASKMTALGVAEYPELRLKVMKDGLYRVTYEAMAAAGVDLAGVPAALVSLTSRAGSVPLRVETGKGSAFGPGGFVEFYGEAVKSQYTETNVYRLAANPKGIDNVMRDPARPGRATPAAYYLETAEIHRQRQWTPVSPIADPWTDERIVAVTNASGLPTVRTYTVGLDNLVTTGAGASVSIGIWAETQKNHVQVLLNGSQIADSTFGALEDATIATPVSTRLLQAGTNSIVLQLPMDHGNRYEIDNLDRYSITYPRAFVARDGRLTFTASGDAFKVGRLPSPSVVVYRITPKKAELLTGASVSGSEGSYEVTFRGSSEPARYVISTEAALLTPELTPVPETKDPTLGSAQYVIISHPDFIDGLGDLVAAKQAQGLTVKVVDVTDVYERFSSGVFDPQAIRGFIAQAAETGTEYVLLVGGDSYDYLGYMAPRSISFIPTLYTRTSQIVGFAPADGLLADLDGDGVADLAIGRLPVRSSADLKAVIAKSIAYAPVSPSAVFAADEKSAADDYAAICDQASKALGAADWTVTKAYVDNLGVAGAKSAMVAAINDGAALTTFVGHSDVTFWSFYRLFTTADVPGLRNGDAPTIVAQWGCWNTFFAHPTLISLGDTFLVTPGPGAAAVVGPSALTESSSDLAISKALSAEIVKGGTLGKALTAAKARVKAQNPEAFDVLRATNLMGDPALALP